MRMGLQASVIALMLTMQLVFGSQVVGQYNLMLDPGRIYWWRTKWVANPIDLSKSNAGSTGVYLTFNFNPSTSLSNGVFEVTLPGSFTTTGISGSGYKVVGTSTVQLLGVTYLAGVDNSLTIGPVGLPSTSAGYGPFALRSRFSPTGQIIDCNLNFASIFLPVSDTKMTTSSVSFVSSASSPLINRTGNTLSFRFSLTKDLWKHDLFKITVDKSFTVVQSTDFMCYSVNYGGYINNFNGTRSANPNYLDCVAGDKQGDGSQVVWIYGLSPDILEVSVKDNTMVDLRIPGFKNPSRNLDSTGYTWGIETIRFATTNTLESASATGPATVTDSLVASWKSTWGISTQNMITGLQFSMDFLVTLTNPIPSGGTIIISTSETLTGCSVLSYIGTGTTCVASAGAITITGFDDMKAGAVAMVSSQVTIASASGKTASITSVVTKWSDGKEVDKSLSIGSFTVTDATIVSQITVFFMTMWDYGVGTTSDTAGGSGSTSQFISFQADYTTIAAASMTLFFPFTSSVQDFQVCIPTATPTVYVHTAAITGAPGTGTLVTSVRKTDGSMSRTDGGITNYVAGQIGFVSPLSAASQKIAIYSTSSAIRLQQTTGSYEIRIEAKASDGRTLIGVSQQFVNLASATVSGGFFCSNIDLPGFPLKVTFLPKVLDMPASTSTKTYYLKITLPVSRFPNYHGSGVGSKGSYPVDTNVSSGATMTVDATATTINHYVYGLGNVSTTGSGVDVYFPVTYSYTSYTVFVVNAYSCFTLTAEKLSLKTEYCTHSGMFISPAGAATTATDPAGVPTITGGGSLITGTTSTAANPLTITVKLTAAITADTYFYISLPRGFTFSQLKDVQSSNPSSGSSFPEKRFFSSTSQSFPFPGVLVKQSFTATQISNSVSTTISIFGLISPLGSYGPRNAVFMHGDLGGVWTNACAYKSSSGLGMTVAKGTIATLVVSPLVIYAQGPSGVDISHSIQVTLPHGIDAGGSIIIVLDPAWTYTAGISTCSVSGLNIDASGTDMCTVSAATVTIGNFKDFSSVTNQVVTIYLNRLLPPTGLTAATTYQFVRSLKTYTSINIENPAVGIDEYSAASGAIVTVNVGITPGVGTFQTISVLPPNAGTTDSDLYLQFTLPYDLPKDSIITITVPYTPISTGSGLNKCWFSPLTYSGCSVSTTISVTIAQKYSALGTLELFVKHAMSAPSDVPTIASGTKYVFKIAATWLGAVIITDSGTNYVGSQIVTPGNKVTAQITSTTPAISFYPRNAGEAAVYTISFKLSIALADTDLIYVIWPDEFDPYVGDAMEMLTQDPGNFYLPCTSNQLGVPTWCTVDHWVMVVKGKTALAAGTQVDLVVKDVRNPGEGATSNFRVFHYDKSLNLLEFANSIGSVTVVTLPTAIQVRLLAVSYPFLGSSADYSLLIYAPVSFDSATSLQLQFPKEYDLSLVDQKDSYTCATQWVDKTLSATITSPQDWNSGASCTQANNFVTLSPPAITKSFLSTNYITWNITAVGNPVWGYTRTRVSAVADFDIQDWDVWTVYSYWSSKFTVFAYWGSTGNLRYVGKSYGHTTSAYLGFLDNKRTITINGYNPSNKSNRIVLWPGTQSSDLTITTANSTVPMEAKSLTFLASTNSRTPDNSALKYTSRVHNFVMLQEEWTINFRVAASIDAVKGLYYIDWKLTEAKQPGVTSEVYRKPPPTLVEIAPKVMGQYWFALAAVPAVSVGGTSVPIKVSISNPPHTAVTISITPALGSVTANPQSLTFRPDVDQLFFYLSVNATHDTNVYPSVVVTFTLSGTDADAFAIQPAIVVGIQSKSLYSTGTITKIGVGNVMRTTVSIAPTTDQLGVLYYAVQPKGAKTLQYKEIQALIPTLIKTDSDLTAETAANAQKRSSFQADPQDNETWEQFQIRVYLNHVTTFQAYGAIAMVSTVTTTPIAITGLFADTSYQIVAYFDNLNWNNTQVATRIEYFDTLSTFDCQPVYVRFQYTVNETLTDTVVNILAKYLGVNPKRMVSRGHALEKYIYRELVGTVNESSNVAFSVFSATILPSRGVETPTPTTISNLTNESVDRMQSDFFAVNIFNRMWNYGPLAIPTRQQPLWSRTPQIQRFSNVSIVIELLSTVAGQSCCVALLDTDSSLKPEQVYRLYDYNWTQAIGQCVSSNITASINYVSLQGLQPDTNYFVHCVAVDQYPLYPTQMTYSSSLPVPFIPLHTVVDLELRYELAWGSVLELGVLAIVLY